MSDNDAFRLLDPDRAAAVLIALFVLSLAISGCSSIDRNNRVEGWPELKVVESKVSFDEAQQRCGSYVSWGQWALGCASFLFHRAECRIYYVFDAVLGHERMHCAGYDHHGSDDMRKMLTDWKARSQ